MRRVLFTPAARLELIDAQDWYERATKGLGRRFRKEVDSTVQHMSESPLRFPVVYKTLRRARVKVFPYALFFLIEDDALHVVACFHSRRKPTHWRSRV